MSRKYKADKRKAVAFRLKMDTIAKIHAMMGVYDLSKVEILELCIDKMFATQPTEVLKIIENK